MVPEPCCHSQRRDCDHGDFGVRVPGRLEQRVAYCSERHRRRRCHNPIAPRQIRACHDQADREEEQSKEEALVVREYLDARQTEHLGQWCAKQEYVRGQVMRVEAEGVHAGRVVEQRIGGLEQVRHPAAVLEVRVAREVREHESAVGGKEQCKHHEDERHACDVCGPE